MVIVAIEGEPATTVPVPTVTPSSVMVTVPEGNAVAGLGEIMSAVTTMEPPADGVSVDGMMVMEVGLFETVMVIACVVEVA
jgi:hypothetical protein